MSFLPPAEKYASAFCPPKVSCRTLRRCFSCVVARFSCGVGGFGASEFCANAHGISPAQRVKTSRNVFMGRTASLAGRGCRESIAARVKLSLIFHGGFMKLLLPAFTAVLLVVFVS